MTAPIVEYEVDPLTSWLATEHPDEPMIRSVVVARQLYVNFFPQGLFEEECRAHTELAHTFLSHTDEEFRSSAWLQNFLATAVPITEAPAAPEEPPLVRAVRQRQASHPYPVPGHLPLDRFPTRGEGIAVVIPEGVTELPALPPETPTTTPAIP